MKLDAKTVAKLALPDGKRDTIYFDDDLTGFGLRLRASGARVRRTWVAQYRAHGRTRRMRIGAAEKLNVDDARKAARKILAKVELGQDPQGDKVKARLASARTLRSVADDYLEAKESVLRPASHRATKLYLTGPTSSRYTRPPSPTLRWPTWPRASAQLPAPIAASPRVALDAHCRLCTDGPWVRDCWDRTQSTR